MKLELSAQPAPGDSIEHGLALLHRFRRDEAGAWYCSCDDSTPWSWPNVVDYVNARRPFVITTPTLLPAESHI